MKYIAMWNMPGCLPEMDPQEFETFDEARDYISDELATLSDGYGPDNLGDADAAAEFAREQSGPFAVLCDGYIYSVEGVQP